MYTIENEIHCIEIIHRKADDFFRVFEFTKNNPLDQEEQIPFDLDQVSLRWDFFKEGDLILSLSGSDIEIVDNSAVFKKNSSFFAYLPLIGNYTHRFYDILTNTTLFDGKLVLDGSGYSASILYSFYGAAAASVTNEAGIKALPQAAIAAQNTFTLSTGTTRTKFIIAIPATKSISVITDTSAMNLQITDDYVNVGTIVVGEEDYDIYELNLSVPYSTSHSHLITIQ